MKRLALVAVLAALLPGSAAATAAKFNPDPVFPMGPISGTTSHQIAKLDRIASALAGRHTTVSCWSKDDWMRLQAWNGAHNQPRAVDASGITWLRTRDIELSPFLCEILQQTLARSADQPLFEAFAITVLAHESAHASGIRPEGPTECRAIATEPRAAALFGISKAEARRFQHIYRGTVYPSERPLYTTPDCKTGLPGVLVPDTLGSAAALRPLQRTVTAVVRTLPHWKNMQGGAGAFGPLSPCSPIADRTLEAGRYQVKLLGPSGSSVDVNSVRLRTSHDFKRALARFRPEPRCSLALMRTRIRETSMSASVVLARVPRAITGLSPDVRAYREVWTERGKRWIDDSIFVFDRRTREIPHLAFDMAAGKVPLAVEVRAVKAALHSLR